jgi:hypothetical protein
MVFGVSIDASFQGGSNGTSGDLVRHWRPGGRFLTAAALHLRHHIRLYTLTFTFGGKGGDYKLPSSNGGGPLEP